MDWTSLGTGLVKLLVPQLLPMAQAGIEMVSIIPKIREGIEAMVGDGSITADDASSMHNQVDAAEVAWAEQVNIAKAELQQKS